MKIDFIRHGETDSNTIHIMHGWTGLSLNKKGLEQAKEAALILSEDYSLIYSSNLERCKQTVNILNKNNLPVIYDDRLRERHYGSLEGKLWSEYDPTGELKRKDVQQKYDYRPFGGESVEDVKKRLFSFFEDVKKSAEEKKVLVVTSSGVIRLLHQVLKGKIPETIHNASIHEFEFPNTVF